jgi:hypothetical protein
MNVLVQRTLAEIAVPKWQRELAISLALFLALQQFANKLHLGEVAERASMIFTASK